ncbi:MAG TPA: hypothetical protein PK256_13795, partial [Verrucomicrobiota bacterium]|nr:hypothetical protein [Verrucomicrobiota bacterium]
MQNCTRNQTGPNKQMHRTATKRRGFNLHRRQTAVVAVASALSVAVGGRSVKASVVCDLAGFVVVSRQR